MQFTSYSRLISRTCTCKSWDFQCQENSVDIYSSGLKRKNSTTQSTVRLLVHELLLIYKPSYHQVPVFKVYTMYKNVGDVRTGKVMTSWYVRALREGRSWQRDDATVDAVQRALL